MTIRDILENQQIRADIRLLRERHDLDHIVQEAKTMGISFNQAPNYPDVLSAWQNTGENQTLVPAYLLETNKALWWIVRQYRLRTGEEVDELVTFLVKSALRGHFVDPVERFLERCRMRSELRRLRCSGKLDQILDDTDYDIVRGDQGDDFIHVYHKEKRSQGAELFSAYSREDVIWWVIRRSRRDRAAKDPTPRTSIDQGSDDHPGRD